ncbi:NUDIX domain-containing protein [Nocardiopsis mangrovi]|uniref:NUDIX domain-containing protein n=1 Tax=Nocardiopsis mangrovi TaxID=1179818 RepID=A0ABV9DZ60_9ACTN
MSAGDGDGWVEFPDGSRRWGRYGAAGLLLHAAGTTGASAPPEGGHVLLQHRAVWSHMGDTWGIPGGALDSDETAVQAAMREFHEEVAGDSGDLELIGVYRQELTVWRYDTVLARVVETRPLTPGDGESQEVRWVPLDEVSALPLIPAFRGVWPDLRAALAQRLEVVVDAAAVLGTPSPEPDSVVRLRDDLAALAADGITAAALPDSVSLAPLERWFPRIRLLVGGAVAGVLPRPGVEPVAVGDTGPDPLTHTWPDAAGWAAWTQPGTLVVSAGPRRPGGPEVVPPGWLVGPSGLLAV